MHDRQPVVRRHPRGGGEAEPVQEAEGEGDAERGQERRAGGVPGDDGGEGDGCRDGDLDPGAGRGEEAGPDEGERRAVAEGEGERPAEGGPHGAGAEQEGEHEEGVVPAVGDDMAEAPSTEVDRRGEAGAGRADEGDLVGPVAGAGRDKLEAVGGEPQPGDGRAEQGVEADAAGVGAGGGLGVEADERQHRVGELAVVLAGERAEIGEDGPFHESERQAPSVDLDRDEAGQGGAEVGEDLAQARVVGHRPLHLGLLGLVGRETQCVGREVEAELDPEAVAGDAGLEGGGAPVGVGVEAGRPDAKEQREREVGETEGQGSPGVGTDFRLKGREGRKARRGKGVMTRMTRRRRRRRRRRSGEWGARSGCVPAVPAVAAVAAV